MSRTKKLLAKKGLIVAVIVIVIVIVLALIVFFTKAYPAGLVGTGYISEAYWEQAQTLGKKLDASADEEQITEQLIRTKKEQQIVASLHADYDKGTVSRELKFYITGKYQEYHNLLDKYFAGDEKLFTEFVIRPQVYDALLRIKYHQDFNANRDAYNRAQNILNEIKNGKSFEDLAKVSSDDKITGQLGGDLGFVSAGQILPELEKIIATSKVGEVSQQIAISRLGYHILYPVETADKDGKVWHVKQILIKTSGFDNWLNPMLNRIWTWRIK